MVVTFTAEIRNAPGSETVIGREDNLNCATRPEMAIIDGCSLRGTSSRTA